MIKNKQGTKYDPKWTKLVSKMEIPYIACYIVTKTKGKAFDKSVFAKVVRNFAHMHCPHMLATYCDLKINLYSSILAQLVSP